MPAAFRFLYSDDWRLAPMAFWVHRPTDGRPWRSSESFEPPAPLPIPHLGYPVLAISFGPHELHFSSPAQLDACIETLARHPLPNCRALCRNGEFGMGPNSHWLSRLPADLKAPRRRRRLVEELRTLRARLVQPQADGGSRWLLA